MLVTVTTARTTWLHRLLPASRWLQGYERSDLTADLRAGATVGVLVIPQAMAYAALAGVPPITGLYAAMVSLVVYALFGTSRFISVGPVAIDSLLTAAAVAPLADGDSARYVALTAAVTVMAGVMQTVAGVVRLGALVNLLSVPVISGFTAAAALTIGFTQLKDLLGLAGVDSTGTSFLDAAREVTPRLGTTDLVTASLGLVALGVLLGLKRWLPRAPGPLLVVAGLTAVGVAVDLSVSTIGDIPSGLPLPRLPDVALDDVRALLPSAAAIALISYMESISTGQVFARRTRTRVEPDQELIAVGLANAAAGLLRGMPVAGGFSRGAVNFEAGARSPMSGVVAAVLIVVSLYLLTPVLALVPKVALAAIILGALGSLVDVRGIRSIARIRRSDLAALSTTALATLLLGPVPGLGIGAALSFALFLRQYSHPHMPELGLVVGEDIYRNVTRHRTATHPALLVVRIDAPMSFVGARQITDHLAALVQQRPELRHLVVDASAVTAIDFTGLEMLGQLVEQLGSAGVELHLAEVRGPVHDVLGRAEWFRTLQDQGRVHDNVARAVDQLPVDLAPPPA
jgi:sulfate permease, SulP family